MCAGNKLVFIHSPGSINGKTKKLAWTEPHNTIPLILATGGVFQPSTAHKEYRAGVSLLA